MQEIIHSRKFQNVNLNFAFVIFITCLFLFSTNFAWAAETNSLASANGYVGNNSGISEGNSGDISVYILQTLFGGMFIFGGGTDGLQDIFYIFNTGLWMLTGVFMIYVMGTVLLASRTGEAGGKFNVFLMTVRSAFGVAMIVPTANGYALIQVLTMWLILQGVAFADVIWGKFASSDTLAKSVAVSPATPNVRALVKDVLIASLCMAAVQAEADYRNDKLLKMGWSFGSGGNFTPLDFSKRGSNQANGMLAEMVKAAPDTNIVLRAGGLSGSIGPNACGEITIKAFNTTDEISSKRILNVENAANAANFATGAILFQNGSPTDGKDRSLAQQGAGLVLMGTSLWDGVSSSYKNWKAWDKWLEVMIQEHANATQTLLVQADEIAHNIVLSALNAEAKENIAKFGADAEKYKKLGINLEIRPTTMNTEQIVSAINGLSSNYINDFRAKAVQSYNGGKTLENFLKQANEYGWWMAGYSVIQIANLNDSANRIALNVPDSSSSFTAPNRELALSYNSRYMAKANEYIELTQLFKNDGFRLPTVNATIRDSISADAAHVASGGSLSMMLEDIGSSVINFSISDSEHPIIQLKRLGTLMITAGTTIFTVMTVKLDKSSNGGLYLLSMMAWGLLSILFMGGVTLCYVLPMMPAMIWTGMIIGWLFMVMELMVIMPMWALTNISLHSGEDFIGNQKIGYTMLLTMILRAPLMTIGVIMMIVLMNVFGIFINSFYTLIYSMAQINANGIANIFLGMFVSPMMYAGLVYVSTKEIMSLMHKIPDNTLAIFGGGQSLGAYGEKMNGGSVAVFGQMNQAAAQPLSSARNTLNEHRQSANTRESVENDKLHRQAQDRTQMLGTLAGVSSGQEGYNKNNNGIYGEQADKVLEAIGKGTLGGKNDNSFTFKEAKDQLLPANSAVKDVAIDRALQKAADWKEATDTPRSYKDFINDVNQNINEEMFGSEQADNLARHADILDVVHGNNYAGQEFMQGFHEKLNGVSERMGVEPEVISDAYVENFNKSMQDLASNNGYILHPDKNNNYAPTGFTSHAIHNDPEVKKLAKSMANVSSKYVNGQSGLPATSPQFDVIGFDSTKNGIRFRSKNYNDMFSNEIKQSSMGNLNSEVSTSGSNGSSSLSGLNHEANIANTSIPNVNSTNVIPNTLGTSGSAPLDNNYGPQVTIQNSPNIPSMNNGGYSGNFSNGYSDSGSNQMGFDVNQMSFDNANSGYVNTGTNQMNFNNADNFVPTSNNYSAQPNSYIEPTPINYSAEQNNVPHINQPEIIQPNYQANNDFNGGTMPVEPIKFNVNNSMEGIQTNTDEVEIKSFNLNLNELEDK